MIKIFLGAVIVAAACSSLGFVTGDGESFIQGTWRLAGGFGDEDEPERVWMLEWTFRNGEFIQTGYPPIRQSGRYEVSEEDRENLKLSLFDQAGTFGDEERVITIAIDRQNARLSIDGRGGFERIIPADDR